MTFMEIALLILGVIIFVISFLLPDGDEKKTEKDLTAEKEEVHKIVVKEIDSMKLKVNEAANDTVEYAVDKAERSLERVSNEKIMAVNEYAGTVLEEINKNHKEVMFLYDMLKDKQTDISNAVRQADAKVKEIENMSHTAQNVSETLLRGMGVASVSQKGLTNEQKAVFDNISIPDAEPVVFQNRSIFQNTASDPIDKVEVANKSAAAKTKTKSKPKPKGLALTQSKIFADLTGQSDVEPEEFVEVTTENEVYSNAFSSGINAPVLSDVKEKAKEKIVYDLLSGSAFKEGNIVNVEAPAGNTVTAADFAAMVNGTINNAGYNPPVSNNQLSQAPANSNDKILELANHGLTNVEIAQKLNLGVGEVKLVIDLFK